MEACAALPERKTANHTGTSARARMGSMPDAGAASSSSTTSRPVESDRGSDAHSLQKHIQNTEP